LLAVRCTCRFEGWRKQSGSFAPALHRRRLRR
jgi:hypothetical protein